ncbi:MAG TPA: electron transfer flavoprotein subunit beta/FixA family protein [bacterium]|nr:electron transfer flavoprotein subunit beta/FixA family protein [bacterium]HEX68211.1 electron transfer flavoprotein subunit beta/FixA family protein [bacterium]
MRIIVCIKQVPDTEHLHEVKINPETNTLVREGIPAIINPFDSNAIEEGLRIKEKFGGEVIVITMGPPQAEKALRDALAMGADKAILITDRKLAGSDTLATSRTLAQAIKKIGNFDLILFGKQAIDGDTAQVGPEVSEILKLPLITFARKIEILDGKVKVERTLEEGYEVVEANLPCAISVTKEINEPRFASMKGILKARKMEIPQWGVEDLELNPEEVGLEGSPTQVVRVFNPPPRPKGEILEGETVEEKVNKLIEKLKFHKIL